MSFAGITATVSAIYELRNMTALTPPCYLQSFFPNHTFWFKGDTSTTSKSEYNCCGKFRNISRHDKIGELFYCKENLIYRDR